MSKEEIFKAVDCTIEAIKGSESYNYGVADALESVLRQLKLYKEWSERQ